MDRDFIKKIIEALIFVSDTPLNVSTLSKVIPDIPIDEIERLIEEIAKEYDELSKPYHIVNVAGGWQFRTRKEFADWILKLEVFKPPRLSRPSLETLSIIAYKQPVTKAEIDFVRGVDSSGVLKTLLEKRLVKILGRKELPGRPLTYGTTVEFLEVFSLKSLSDLPPIEQFTEFKLPSENIQEAQGILFEKKEEKVEILNETNEIDDNKSEPQTITDDKEE